MRERKKKDAEEYRRCGRRGTPNWRCSERALSGKAFCEKHHLYAQRRQMEMQKRKSENGSKTEVGQKRKKQKQSEEISANFGQSSELCVGDQGHQVAEASTAGEENGGNNGNEAFDIKVFQELFGEDEGGILVSEELQVGSGKEANENGGLGGSGEETATCGGNDGLDFTAELFEGLFGEVSAENGGLGPAGEGIDSLFDEVNGGSGNRGMDFCGQGFGLFGSLDGNGIQGLFGEIPCGNGDQGEFSVNANENGGKDEMVKIKNKRGRPKGAKNKKKVIGAQECIEGLIKVAEPKKKRGRPKGSKNKRKVNLQERNQELADQIMNVKDCGNKIAMPMENVGTSDLVDVKVMIGQVTGGSNEIFRAKVRRGRPKGAKNKMKIDAGGERVDGKYSGVENVRPKKKRGRPKGFIRTKKTSDAQEGIVQSSGNGIVQPKYKQVQPHAVDEYPGIDGKTEGYFNGIVGNIFLTGSDSRGDSGMPIETIGGDRVERENYKQKVKCGRPKSLKNKKEILSAEEIIEQLSTRDEIVQLKRKRGRPKGSKTKKKCLTGEENQRMFGEIVCDNGSSHGNVLPVSTDNMRTALVGEEDKGMPGEVSGSDIGENLHGAKHDQSEVLKAKETSMAKEEGTHEVRDVGKSDGRDEKPNQRGQAKGAKNKRTVLFREALNVERGLLVEDGKDISHIGTKTCKLSVDSVNIQKRPRGRPKKICNQSDISKSIVSSSKFIVSQMPICFL